MAPMTPSTPTAQISLHLVLSYMVFITHWGLPGLRALPAPEGFTQPPQLVGQTQSDIDQVHLQGEIRLFTTGMLTAPGS